VRRRAALLGLPLLVACSFGCGSGSSQVSFSTPGAAKITHLAGFTPTGPVQPGKPVTVSFHVVQPDGATLTQYQTGPGPHTGVHLILVRNDLSQIVHLHPPISEDGHISTPVTFPAPGPYTAVIDIYQHVPGQQFPQNYQLKQHVQVQGAYHPQPLGPVRSTVTTDGYTFTIHGNPKLRASQADYLNVSVTGPDGKPVTFTPWYGASAHAIFFQRGSPIAYFHTHICAPGEPLCAANSAIAGSSTKPGQLRIGAVFPEGGRWRLFLQGMVGDRIVTAPFTLNVRS
jgi:hypothetical protein